MPTSHFPNNIIENPPTPHNSAFIGPNSVKFGTKTRCKVLKVVPKFGEIDDNLHNHVFDHVICKPPLGDLRDELFKTA